MAQWVNRLRNNIFINPPPLPLSCEISEALHLGPSLTLSGASLKFLLIKAKAQFAFRDINIVIPFFVCINICCGLQNPILSDIICR